MSVKFLVRNSGAGNGCANFMGAWTNEFFLQKKKPMSIETPPFRGGGLGGGGSADFILMGARIFLIFRPKFFRGRPRGMSVPKCFFFQDLEGLTEVFGRMSVGTSGRKLPLWADFSFLKEGPWICRRSSVKKNGESQRALRDRLMSRGKKNCLPTVSRQFLTRNCPRPNCLLKCLPNGLSPTREGFLSSFKINPAARVIARQVRDKICLAAIFAPRHQSVSSGPLSEEGEGVPEVGTKPLKALRGYRASNRGSNRGSRGSNRGSKGSRKTPEALRG